MPRGTGSGSSDEAVYRELLKLGEREGMSASKLETSSLLDRMDNWPESWTLHDRARALSRLIVDCVEGIKQPNHRSAARAALNIAGSEVAGDSAKARWKALAQARLSNETTMRKWWYSAVEALARSVPDRISVVSREADWPKYRTDVVVGDPDFTLPPYRFVRVDTTWWLQGRVGTETITHRRIEALQDGVDAVPTFGRYYSDGQPGATHLEPLANCELGPVRNSYRGAYTQVLLPGPLAAGDEAYYSFRIRYTSQEDCEPVVAYDVTAQSVGLFVARLQFDPAELPARCWFFRARTPTEAVTPPEPSDTSRDVPVNRLGYCEKRFSNCSFGVTFGLAWDWK